MLREPEPHQGGQRKQQVAGQPEQVRRTARPVAGRVQQEEGEPGIGDKQTGAGHKQQRQDDLMLSRILTEVEPDHTQAKEEDKIPYGIEQIYQFAQQRLMAAQVNGSQQEVPGQGQRGAQQQAGI